MAEELQFVRSQGVEEAVSRAMSRVVRERPADGVARLGELLLEEAGDAGAIRARLQRAVDTALRELAPSLVDYAARIATDSSRMARGQWATRGEFAAFLSHYKVEAATEARLIQIELERHLHLPPGKIFIDSDTLKDLRRLRQHVRDSDVLVLLLTSNFLTRPWCLLEIYTAITESVPIVALNINGAHPYNYSQAAAFLQELDTELDRGAMQLLVDHGIEPTAAGARAADWFRGSLVRASHGRTSGHASMPVRRREGGGAGAPSGGGSRSRWKLPCMHYARASWWGERV